MVVAVTAAIVMLWLVMPSEPTRSEALAQVSRWTYQLQDFASTMQRVARSDSDMLVIDYAIDDGDGLKPLKRETVEALKRKPDGSRRLVIAYFSVGEAEEYRPYWRVDWNSSPPDWIIAENCRWPKNHLVKFWDKGWRDIIFAGETAYLKAIQDAGFDGVYLDRVDVYADIADRFPEARQRMISFVKDLAAIARARDPDFLVVVQNAEELLDDASYRHVISAVAKEDLLHGVNETGKRNPPAMIEGSTRLLDQLRDDGKPVFAVEYLTNAEAIAHASSELSELDYIGVFPPRALDGSDPVKAKINSSEAAASDQPVTPETGTPEYASARCDGVWKREGNSDSARSSRDLPPAARE